MDYPHNPQLVLMGMAIILLVITNVLDTFKSGLAYGDEKAQDHHIFTIYHEKMNV